MIQIGLTSLVNNEPYAKQLGVPPTYYRWRSCNTNLTGSSPADQYQRLKLIQNTVRAYGSLYTANLGPLSAYQQPTKEFHGVCWNQMSDRAVPSVQRSSVPTGFNSALNRRHTSVTSSKPGSQTPGGAGCDIKHNSYDRYLNRIKGKGPLRRGYVPPGFGAPIPFNPAFPIYGGKTTKTSIVNGCNCPPGKDIKQDERIYAQPLAQPYPVAEYTYNVGDTVYAIKSVSDNIYLKATIIDIIGSLYTVQFEDGTIRNDLTVNDIKNYFPCSCDTNNDALIFDGGLCELNENIFVSN